MTVVLQMSDHALQDAIEAVVDPVVVVGINKDGDFHFGSTTTSAAEIIFLLTHGIWRLNQQTDMEIGMRVLEGEP